MPLLCEWPTQLSIHSSQRLPCISIPRRNGSTFCPTFGEKKKHQNKCSFPSDICRGQTSNRAHVQPTLASESRLAGSAGMLSSTVLVSTATTPTGIPPSLVTCETNQNSHFYCYTTRHFFFQFASKYSRETNHVSKWWKKQSGLFEEFRPLAEFQSRIYSSQSKM